jgi:hypothetical protein
LSVTEKRSINQAGINACRYFAIPAL